MPLLAPFPLPVRGPVSVMPPRPRGRKLPPLAAPACFCCGRTMDLLEQHTTDLWECGACEVRQVHPPRPHDPLPDYMSWGLGYVRVIDHAIEHVPVP